MCRYAYFFDSIESRDQLNPPNVTSHLDVGTVNSVNERGFDKY